MGELGELGEARKGQGERGEQGGRPNRLKKTDRSVCLVPSIKVEALACGKGRDFVGISWGWTGSRFLIVFAYRATLPNFDGEGWGRVREAC
jgi:hypothetical protein